MKELITAILIILFFSVSGSLYAQKDQTQEEVKQKYLETLIRYQKIVCRIDCKIIGAECICENTGHFSQEDDINLDPDSLTNLGNNIAGLINQIGEREQRLRNELNELELMKSNTVSALQMISIVMNNKIYRKLPNVKSTNKYLEK